VKGLAAGEEPSRRGYRRSRWLAGAVLAASLWLLWETRLEVAYFASSPTPIDLGVFGGLHLERARSNRLVRVAGPVVGLVPGVEGAGERRRVSGLFGTNLMVDRPASASPAAVYEGRLLPSSRQGDYAPFAGELGKQGWVSGDKFMVLREGERPRTRYREPLLALLLLSLASFNGAYLVRSLLPRRRP